LPLLGLGVYFFPFASEKKISAKDFNDSNTISAYAKEAVNTLVMQGIISGKPGDLFDPQGNATRAEFAAMLHRFLEAVN
jgi:hypothetical protein